MFAWQQFSDFLWSENPRTNWAGSEIVNPGGAYLSAIMVLFNDPQTAWIGYFREEFCSLPHSDTVGASCLQSVETVEMCLAWISAPAED